MYPKWVSRGHGIGQILCLNQLEEDTVNSEREAREGTPPKFNIPAEAVQIIREEVPLDEFVELPTTIVMRKKPGPKPKVK
jgi:hypothetical protein